MERTLDGSPKEIFGADNRKLFTSLNCPLCKRPYSLNRQERFAFYVHGAGYHLSMPFPVPECIVCHEPYSKSIAEYNLGQPQMLDCGHALCTRCFAKMLGCGVDVICPKCKTRTKKPRNAGAQRNGTLRFLVELGDLTKDYQRNTILIKKCYDCQETDKIDDFLSCRDCKENSICAICAFRNHRTHNVIELIDEEVKKISLEISEAIQRECKTYLSTFPELQKDLENNMRTFEKLALERSSEIGQLKKYQKAEDHKMVCDKIRDAFEAISEQYMGNLRLYDTKIRKLNDLLRNGESQKEKQKSNPTKDSEEK